jgi:hypothetical protein
VPREVTRKRRKVSRPRRSPAPADRPQVRQGPR